jgi:hypothetical protein
MKIKALLGLSFILAFLKAEAQTPAFYVNQDTTCRRQCLIFTDSTITPRPSNYTFVFTVPPPQASITCLGTGCIIHQDTVFVTLSDTLTKYPPPIKVCYYSNSALNSGGCFPATEIITNVNGTNSTTKCVVVTEGPLASAGPDTIVCINGSIHLSGNHSAGVGPITYFWSGPNGFTSTASNPVISNATLLNSGPYLLTVTSSPGGCKDTANVNVTVNSCSGIEQMQNNDLISIYPNPGNGHITITNSQILNEIKIMNLIGEITYQQKPDSQKVILQIEKPGVYFVAIKCGTQTTIKKLIVQ